MGCQQKQRSKVNESSSDKQDWQKVECNIIILSDFKESVYTWLWLSLNILGTSLSKWNANVFSLYNVLPRFIKNIFPVAPQTPW